MENTNEKRKEREESGKLIQTNWKYMWGEKFSDKAVAYQASCSHAALANGTQW